MSKLEPDNNKIEFIDYTKKFDYVCIIMMHEEPQCIIDMICNIKTLNPKNSMGFYIHLSKNFTFKNANDYNLFCAIKNGTVFPKNYYVHISEKSYITRWGKIGYQIINSIEDVHSIFINAEYVILLASNCLQFRENIKVPWYNCNHLQSKPEFGIEVTFQCRMKDGDPFLKNKFLKHLHDNKAKFIYHIHEGLYMSRNTISNFLKLWRTIYTTDDDPDYIKDTEMWISEEYMLGTYLLSLPDTHYTHGLCIRHPEYVELIDKPTHAYMFTKPIHRAINNAVREKLRQKYNYNSIVHKLISNHAPCYKLDLAYKNFNEISYPNSNINKFKCEIYSNSPRVFSFDYCSKSSTDTCVFSTGSAGNNNCFNFTLNCKADTIGIMCYNNDISNRISMNLNDAKWKNVIIVFKINTVFVYINDTIVLQKELNKVDTFGDNCIMGQSNHSGFEKHFTGSIKNMIIFSGMSEDYKTLKEHINSIISNK